MSEVQTPADAMERIRDQINKNSIILYMKGTPQMPMCGFSARTVEALKKCNKEFAYVNIIADVEVHENLPQFSDWPTFPQLFVNGELVGGCDITCEMADSGELQKLVDQAAAA